MGNRLRKMVKLAKAYKMSAEKLAKSAGISKEFAERLLKEPEKKK